MWQSSMLISLLVLSHEQINVSIWVKHGSSNRGPITLLEPLVVLIGRHKDMLVKISQTRTGRVAGGKARQENWVSMECWSGVWGNGKVNLNFPKSQTQRRKSST